MALSKKTISKHNLKRAEVFAANGLCDMDIAFAHPDFLGYGQGECALCGKKHLKWLFEIRFAAPDMVTMFGKIATDITRTEEVTLQPIGSKCIGDWLDAIPESAEKMEALKRWAVELDKCKVAMKAKVVEQLRDEAGYASPEAASDEWAALHKSVGRHAIIKIVKWKGYSQLRNNMRGICYKSCTRATAKGWLANLAALKAAQGPKAPEEDDATDFAFGANTAAESAPVDPSSDEGLVERADAILGNPTTLNGLKPYCQTALADIAEKFGKYKSFAPGGKQRKFFASMIESAEKKVASATSAAPNPTTKPGDANFASHSGIFGARY